VEDLAHLDFRFWSCRDYHMFYKSKKLTPTQVVERLLQCIHESNTATPPLRAFSHVNAQDVMEQAQASTQRWNQGKPISVLDGVPVGVKDELDVRGYATWLGTKFFGSGKLATQDGYCIAKLREAGAIIVGKTGMAEIGTETLNCNPNPAFGTPRNPVNIYHHTGGSSGGSAAAVAAGFVPLAIGADGGGSVRIPASFCGVWGIKPTWGRISGAPSPNLDPSTGHIGPIAANLEDLAIGYAAMAGPDPAVRLHFFVLLKTQS
jgi:Asp-tRNA(Asn)/Glu-tRNA(Gln) amidotransferase A subunit family amidase